VRTTATGNALGIGVQTKHFNTQIYNNVVKNVAKIGGTAASTVSGITAFGTAGDTTNSNIYNNMIYNMDNSSTSTTSLIRGLYLSTGLRDTVAYNSVSIAGTDAASIVTAALVVGFPNATAEQTWHNNIGINARTATGTGRALAFYSNTTSGQYLTNYNDLYVMSQAGSHVAAVTTTNYTTLGDWQGTGRDANSISEMANFIAPDLHIDENITTGLSGAATPLPGFTVDFDGNNRSAAIPDIGADEFNQAPAGFVIFEEFETTTFPPSGWSSYIFAGDSGWIHTTTFPLNGTYAARNRYQPAGTLGSKFLVTKRVDLMPGSNYELSFWMRRQFSTAFPPDTVYIRTSTTDSLPASFGAAIYKCYTGAIADTATDPNIYGLVYRKFRTTVTDPNVKYIAFDHQDNDGQTIFMDDVALQSLLGHDIGVSSVASASPGSGQSDSPENGSRNPALNREEKIAAEQGRAITIASPVTGPIVLGSTTQGSVTLEARVANFGGFVENSYQVGWSIDGVPQSDVTNIDPLEIGDSDTLALVWSTPTSGIHTARAWSILTGDVDASNDTSGVYTFEVLGANVLFAEGFNDPTFPPAGWTTINRDGGGTTGPWFAGNVTVFPPFEGSGYAADNFNTANGFYIDDYLITPNVAGPAPGPNDVDSLTFWMRSPDPNNFPDSLMILVSTTGIDTSNFTVNLGYYNAPTSWTRFAFALPTGANRYVAFRYLIYDGGPSGTNSNYVGVDDVRITRYTQAGPEPLMNLVHTPGNLNAAIFNDGSIGADNVGFAGPGITWLGQNGTFVGGPIFGTTARGSVNGLIGSFSIAGQLVNVTSNFAGGFTSDANFNQIATALLDDSGAPVPYAVRILQKSYSNTGEEFVFVRYGYINTTGSAINGFHAGIFNDWDINATTFTTNSGGYDLTRDLVYQFDNGTPPTPYYYGFATLDGLSGARVTTATPPAPTATGSFTWITTFDPTILPNGDFRTWQGTGPMDIAPGDTAWTTFAIVAGNDLAGIQANTDAAKAKAIALGWIIPTGVEDPTAGLPESFDLAQNYPNPFNPTTVIRYALPEPSSVTLKIYNVLGQQIAELVNDVKDAGFFQTEWNGRNQYGQLVSSGVYFYRMEARGTNGGNVFVSEKKMLMLK
ncbi:MAG TPA: choice-of-anchor J domain-containing protein, partial [Bacteroidota bacterium]